VRCAADAQTPDLAQARLEWVRRCALRNLTPADGVGSPGGLFEYYECNTTTNPWCQSTFTGENGVNSYEMMLTYLSGTTTQFVDPYGFYRWSTTRRKARPLYAIYGSSVDVNSSPTVGSYDCRPYRAGNSETCIIPAPAAGTYFVMLRAFATYSGVTLVGR
jgi:hypothetical protein